MRVAHSELFSCANAAAAWPRPDGRAHPQVRQAHPRCLPAACCPLRVLTAIGGAAPPVAYEPQCEGPDVPISR